MRLTSVFCLAACVGLSAGAASAQDRASRFVQRDANGDGVLSPHEYQTTGGHPGNFRALDTNGDGLLSRSEFLGREGVDDQVYEDRAYESVKVDPRQDPSVLTKSRDTFLVKDRNRDGLLTRGEYADARTFARVDRNDDGRISYDEFRNPPPATVAYDSRGTFQGKDRNRDGLLTRAEYGDSRSFRRVDRNRDGRISYDEFLHPPVR